MLYVLAGASGTGKNTLGNELEKQGIEQLVSYTTRAKREGEVDGVDYHFTDIETFKGMETFEEINYAGNYYGFSLDEVKKVEEGDRDYYAIVNKEGYEAFINYFGKSQVKLIYIIVPENELEERMRSRGDTEENIKNRMTYYRETLSKERALKEQADVVIENIELEKAKQDLLNNI